MAKFVVEIINADRVERRKIIEALTPIDAASETARSPVTFRRDEEHWIRVTPTGSQISYGFVRVFGVEPV